jgi:hypothetical protein
MDAIPTSTASLFNSSPSLMDRVCLCSSSHSCLSFSCNLLVVHQQVHGVIIMLPMDEVKAELESKEWWKRLTDFRQQIHERGSSTVCLLPSFPRLVNYSLFFTLYFRLSQLILPLCRSPPFSITSIGLFGVIALTKVDLIDSKLSTDVASIYNSNEVNKLCGIVSEKTGFDLRRIFPMKLYHNEPQRSNLIECLAMEALAGVTQQVE